MFHSRHVSCRKKSIPMSPVNFMTAVIFSQCMRSKHNKILSCWHFVVFRIFQLKGSTFSESGSKTTGLWLTESKRLLPSLFVWMHEGKRFGEEQLFLLTKKLYLFVFIFPVGWSSFFFFKDCYLRDWQSNWSIRRSWRTLETTRLFTKTLTLLTWHKCLTMIHDYSPSIAITAIIVDFVPKLLEYEWKWFDIFLADWFVCFGDQWTLW